MRHYLCCGGAALTPLVHAGRVFVAPGATLLIALAGFTLAAQSGDVRELCSAVALATVALAAHQNSAMTGVLPEMSCTNSPAGFSCENAARSKSRPEAKKQNRRSKARKVRFLAAAHIHESTEDQLRETLQNQRISRGENEPATLVDFCRVCGTKVDFDPRGIRAGPRMVYFCRAK
jgi:plasmid stability protein